MAAAHNNDAGNNRAGRVLGLGGIFFRARDPEALTAWYRDMLGVGAGCSGTDDPAGEWT